MEDHHDKGRYIVSVAILMAKNISHELWMLAFDCINAYKGEKI
jgi:hypothetical protein